MHAAFLDKRINILVGLLLKALKYEKKNLVFMRINYPPIVTNQKELLFSPW